MALRCAPVAELLERAPEAEVRVVVGRVVIDDGSELFCGAAIAAAAKVGAPERLADRALVRLEPLRLLEGHGRLCPVTLGDQRETALEKGVRVLVVGVRIVGHRLLRSRGLDAARERSSCTKSS